MKRRCETCRFFEATEKPGIGHCLHPACAIGGLPILVRGIELHCRSGWQADLWESSSRTEPAVGHGSANFAGNGLDTSLRTLADGGSDSRPAAALPLPFVDGQDLLVHEAPSLRFAFPAPEPVAPEPSDSGDSNETRDLILRARDIHRLRLTNRTRPMLAPSPGDGLGEHAGGRLDGTDSAPAAPLSTASKEDHLPVAADASEGAPAPRDVRSQSSVVEGKSIEEQIAARMAEIGPVPPVPASEMRTDLLGWGATRQEAQDRFETVPAVDPNFKLPFRETPRSARLRAGFDDPGTPPISTAEPAPESTDHADTDQVDLSSSLQSTRQGPAEAAWPGVPLKQADDDQRQPEVSRWASSIEDADRRSRRRASRRERAGTARLESDGNATLDVPSVSQPQVWIEPRPAGAFQGVQHGEADRVPVDAAIAADAWPAPALSEEPDRPLHDGLARYGDQSYLFDERLEQLEFLPDVPRCCRTCREYRPSDSGERGWCTSAWAFQHRRMVGADELPCGSAIGIWWLPRDDVWLDDLDVDHGRPTPLVEAMLARHYGAGGPPTPRLRRRGR